MTRLQNSKFPADGSVRTYVLTVYVTARSLLEWKVRLSRKRTEFVISLTLAAAASDRASSLPDPVRFTVHCTRAYTRCTAPIDFVCNRQNARQPSAR